MKGKWQPVRLSDVLTTTRKQTDIDPFGVYKQITVKLNHKGVVIRKEINGSTIRSKQYRAGVGQFITSRIDARNGATGLIPSELDGAIVTNDFLTYDINENKLVPKYFDYLTSTESFVKECIKASEGTTNRVRLQPDKFLDIEIPLPSLTEQKRIVAEIEGLMAKVEQARKTKKEMVGEILAMMSVSIAGYCFDKGYPLSDFGQVLEHAKNGIYKPTSFLGYGIPCIRMFNISNGRITVSNIVLIDVTEAEAKEYECRPGDIVFNRVNSKELVGKAGIVPENFPRSVFESKNIRLRVNREKSIPEFANYIINSPNSRRYFSKVIIQQCGQATLNRKHLNNMPFPTVPLPEQRRTVAYLDSLQAKVDELKKLQAETKKELEELVPSILDKAFKGEL